MITPRQTRLHRVPDLRGLQRAIIETTSRLDLAALRDCVVIVPSAVAADQLRRTLENHALQLDASASFDRAVCVPDITTRAGWYEILFARLTHPPRRLSAFEREVLLGAAARAASEGGTPPPFRLRPGLLVEVLSLYDELRRLNQTVDRFERATADELEGEVDTDRGAERLLEQTRFLAAAFRGYEARMTASDGVDEHSLRAELLQTASARPLRRIVITVGDRAGDPDGLWPADFDLLARLPSLESIDIISTAAVLSAGLHDRIHEALPGIEDWTSDTEQLETGQMPALLAPADDQSLFFVSRDREEEVAGIARRIKRLARSAGSSALERTAVVFKRPLPYVYLARETLDAAGIPHQTADALPLAAEPYAAALDLIFDFFCAGFTRAATIALLGSPQFSFVVRGRRVGRSDVAELDRALVAAGYLGDADRLRELADGASGRMSAGAARAAEAAASAAAELSDLCADQPPSRQVAAVLRFLRSHEHLPGSDDPRREAHLRARAAIQTALASHGDAHARFDDEPRPFGDVAGTIRRWIETQMFAPRRSSTGVQFLDAQAARYGEFDDVCLVGLIDSEWPQRPPKNIFFPRAVLKRLNWPDPGARLAGERAAFEDLLRLARRRVAVSTFRLENDAIVGPSVVLEDLDRAGLPVVREQPALDARVFLPEALTGDPLISHVLEGEPAEWLAARTTRLSALDPVFHGTVGAHDPEVFSLTSLEQYLKCPFQFFAQRVLKLEEEPEDEPTLTPRARGIFVHSVFQAFFSEWAGLGRQAITMENLAEARKLFRAVVEPLLNGLPAAEATVERARLLGTAADEGLGEAVFRLEAERPTPIVERLLEYPLDGEFAIQTGSDVRRVPLRGIADRIDLLADDTFRLLDYKLGRAPKRAVALQLPIYALCAEQRLSRDRGRDWRTGEAGYVAFGEPRRFVSMLARGGDREVMLRDAQTRLLLAIDGISRGEFPPHPVDEMLCTYCPHSAVCRKDYVGEV